VVMEEAILVFHGSGRRGGYDFGINSFKLPFREIPKDPKSSDRGRSQP
jgi:hypothetical protein